MPDRASVAILDCDFGRGEVESEVLSGAGYDCVLSDLSASSELGAVGEVVGVLTQYTPVTASLMDRLPKLRAVVRYGVGVDVVDVDEAERRGIRVSGVPDYCVDEVADHTLGLMLATTRSIPWATEQVHAGGWPPPQAMPVMTTLRRRRIGIVGFGRIGRAVASRCRAFGPEILVHDPFVDSDLIHDDGCVAVDLDYLLRAADLVSLHLPATQTTRQLVNADRLAMLPRGSIVINVSRGALIDEEALAEALRTGQVAAAALDVLQTESVDSPLVGMSGVLVTPHVAYYSTRALNALRRNSAETMVRLLCEENL